MRIALGSGYFDLEIYNPNGEKTQDLVGMPVVAMDTLNNPNSKEPLKIMKGLISKADFPKITRYLNVDDQKDLWPLIYYDSLESKYGAFSDWALRQWVAEQNQFFFENNPDTTHGKDFITNIPYLPDGIDKVFFLFTKKMRWY